jgi:hypothetical protein
MKAIVTWKKAEEEHRLEAAAKGEPAAEGWLEDGVAEARFSTSWIDWLVAS